VDLAQHGRIVRVLRPLLSRGCGCSCEERVALGKLCVGSI
jgi:hypothetical protein